MSMAICPAVLNTAAGQRIFQDKPAHEIYIYQDGEENFPSQIQPDN